jgi:hypothetical protein
MPWPFYFNSLAFPVSKTPTDLSEKSAKQITFLDDTARVIQGMWLQGQRHIWEFF